MPKSRKAKYKRENAPLESHWEGVEPDTERYFGFVYLITNTTNGRLYIGKKQYFIAKQGSPKSRITARRSKKWNMSHWSPSKWEVYAGSSRDLTNDICKLGKDKFTFEILSQQLCKGDLHYAEIKEQVERDVLVAEQSDGAMLYYNKSIAAIKFRPPSYWSEAQREKMKGEGNNVHRAISNGNHYTKGTGHTDESRKKMSESQKIYFANMTEEDKLIREGAHREGRLGTRNGKFRPWAYKEPDGEWVEVYDKTIKQWYTDRGFPKVKIASKSFYNKRSDAFYYRWEFKIL